jgi:hypothetical protein
MLSDPVLAAGQSPQAIRCVIAAASSARSGRA